MAEHVPFTAEEERIARIIAPDAWLLFDQAGRLTVMRDQVSGWRIEPSVLQARAILSLPSPDPDVEGLAGRLEEGAGTVQMMDFRGFALGGLSSDLLTEAAATLRQLSGRVGVLEAELAIPKAEERVNLPLLKQLASHPALPPTEVGALQNMAFRAANELSAYRARAALPPVKQEGE